jgi:hypothetical protein
MGIGLAILAILAILAVLEVFGFVAIITILAIFCFFAFTAADLHGADFGAVFFATDLLPLGFSAACTSPRYEHPIPTKKIIKANLNPIRICILSR